MIRQKNKGSPQTKPSLSKIDWESREVWLGQPIRKTPSCLWWWMWILCINQPGCPGILSNLILDFCEDVSQRDQYLNLWAIKQSLLPDAVGLSNQLKTWKGQKAGLQQVKGDFLCWAAFSQDTERFAGLFCFVLFCFTVMGFKRKLWLFLGLRPASFGLEFTPPALLGLWLWVFRPWASRSISCRIYIRASLVAQW